MKNNKKKVLPLLLAGVLLLSAGAYGTRAYFTDSKDQKVEIVLSVGNLKITSDNTTVWNYTPEIGSKLDEYDINDQLIVKDKNDVKIAIWPDVKESYNLDTKITVSNVRPGDVFSRDFIFTNTGSLTQKVTLTKTLPNTVEPFTVQFTDKTVATQYDKDGILILEPGEKALYNIKISVLGTVAAPNNAEPNKVILDYLNANLNVVATQPNAN